VAQRHTDVVKWCGRMLEASVIEDSGGEVLRLGPDALAA